MVGARARGAATAHGRRFDSRSATTSDRARLAHAHSPGVLGRALLCQTAGDHARCALCDHRHYLDIEKRMSHTHRGIPSQYLRAVRAVEPLPTMAKTPALLTLPRHVHRGTSLERLPLPRAHRGAAQVVRRAQGQVGAQEEGMTTLPVLAMPSCAVERGGSLCEQQPRISWRADMRRSC